MDSLKMNRLSFLFLSVRLLFILILIMVALLTITAMLMREVDESKSHPPLLPLCTTDADIFQKDETNSIYSPSVDDLMYGATKQKCRLRLMRLPRDFVACIENLHSQSSRQWIHFTFIGDSRMRQQFYNFVKVIADGDQQQNLNDPNSNKDPLAPIHQDITLKSQLLQTVVTFLWRPVLDANFTKEITQWAIEAPRSDSNPPDFVFIGVAAHHILIEKNHKQYQRILQDIEPVLNRLATNCSQSKLMPCSKIIFLNQFPVIDFWSIRNDAYNTEIYEEKMHQYNLILRHTFRNSPVVIWDSANPLAEEYIRACNLLKRKEVHPRRVWLDATEFYSCFDSIHTGYVALSQATQIIWNGICNKFEHNKAEAKW